MVSDVRQERGPLMCPRCHEPLRRSRYIKGDRDKSCPKCSVRQGVHVYYSYHHFGMRHGGTVVQSWCPTCRSGGAGKSRMLCP